MTSVQITRVLAGPPDRVWAAFTEPAALAAWFWPPRLLPAVSAEIRVGGAYRIEGTGMAVSGVYLQVERLRCLVFTWRWEGDEAESLVTLEFEGWEGNTLFSLRHDHLATAQERDSHAQGWNDCLDRLPLYISLAGTSPTR